METELRRREITGGANKRHMHAWKPVSDDIPMNGIGFGKIVKFYVLKIKKCLYM